MNELAVDFLERKRAKPFSLFFAHKAVHPDAQQAADGTFDISARRRLHRRRAPPRSLPGRDVPEEAEHAAARRGGEAEAGLGRGASASRSRERAQAMLTALHAGRAGGDPAARAR